MTALEQKDKLRIVDRLDQENVLTAAKRFDRAPHIGVSVYREDNGDIRSLGDARHRAADPLEPAVEAFAARWPVIRITHLLPK
jgi:hypothetical protein